MEMLGKIRRMYFRDKLLLHQIAKRTGLSRDTIREWGRAPEATQPAYEWCARQQTQSFPRDATTSAQGRFVRPKHNRRSAKVLFEQIKAQGTAAATASSRRLYSLGEVSKASLYALLFC